MVGFRCVHTLLLLNCVYMLSHFSPSCLWACPYCLSWIYAHSQHNYKSWIFFICRLFWTCWGVYIPCLWTFAHYLQGCLIKSAFLKHVCTLSFKITITLWTCLVLTDSWTWPTINSILACICPLCWLVSRAVICVCDALIICVGLACVLWWSWWMVVCVWNTDPNAARSLYI